MAEYLIPVNADVQEVTTILLPEQDAEINPMGIKGIGELGNVGLNAAVANAVFHATGVRVRELPIRIEKLLDGFEAVALCRAGVRQRDPAALRDHEGGRERQAPIAGSVDVGQVVPQPEIQRPNDPRQIDHDAVAVRHDLGRLEHRNRHHRV